MSKEEQKELDRFVQISKTGQIVDLLSVDVVDSWHHKATGRQYELILHSGHKLVVHNESISREDLIKNWKTIKTNHES